ncbi:RelA/SpoT domain-containing protein [Luteibacter sp. ME-Dv--P-043b]|uniref:RelA/SpoT domain-containing protein n=1 Tax=Luteibacter sp. ME-Dv--P-043b TaxID=3040291 RepID=UPI0025525FA6|nr:RelA/SpoT domain-containing protein [Luteibacter sp. ME-Dv--P-043b]
MSYAQPQYSRKQVARAGEVLRRLYDPSNDFNDAFDALLPDAFKVLSNWRSSHGFPLNTLTVSLKKHARVVSDNAVVVQRLKRLWSIMAKLERETGMSLSRMQDIGGCRAVMPNVQAVYALRDRLIRSSMRHELRRHTDYIANPKTSGYRGIHLIYLYKSDRSQVYNNLSIEVQIRSRLQHAWATAVETVGTFLQQSLKASQGSAEWLEFFEVVSRALSFIEDVVPLPDVPRIHEIFGRVQELSRALNVRQVLDQYGRALQSTTENGPQDAAYYLLTLLPEKHTLTIQSYTVAQLTEANERYTATEQALSDIPGAQVVLVSAESLAALRSAYPNYFLDTDLFIEALTAIEQNDLL